MRLAWSDIEKLSIELIDVVQDSGVTTDDPPGSVSIGLYDIKSREEASLFGVVEVDGGSKIVSFEEKPAKARSSLIAMCFYYLPQNTLGLINDYLVESQKSDRAGDYIRWLTEKGDVFGFTFEGKWYDIGSVEAYEEAKQKFGQ